MKSKKITYLIIVLLLIGILSIFFVACDNNNQNEQNDDEIAIKDDQGNEYVLTDDGVGYALKYVNAGEAEDIVVPQMFNDLPVKSVMAYSFIDCDKVKSIYVPNGIDIQNAAFYGCSHLESLSIPEMDYCVLGQLFGTRFFEGSEKTDHDLYGSSSKNYYIPISLVSVELNNASNLWTRCFSNCKYIESICISGSVETISTCAFGDCIALKNISLPESIKKIEPSGFAGCTSLQHIELPQNLKTIDDFAFMGDCALIDIVIPDSVSSIGVSAFNGCSNLKNITIGESVSHIRNYAFAYCGNVENLYYNAKNAYVGRQGMVFANLGNKTSGAKVYIGSSVEEVPDNFLYSSSDIKECPNVSDIVFSDNNNCTIIGNYAFTHLQNLKNVVLADGITEIGEDAFWYCSSLEKIKIPKTVIKIHSSVFSNNKNLTEVEFEEIAIWNVYITSDYYITVSVANPSQNAIYFTDKYRAYTWEKA